LWQQIDRFVACQCVSEVCRGGVDGVERRNGFGERLDGCLRLGGVLIVEGVGALSEYERFLCVFQCRLYSPGSVRLIPICLVERRTASG